VIKNNYRVYMPSSKHRTLAHVFNNGMNTGLAKLSPKEGNSNGTVWNSR
jgi:hypothetical protein